MTHCLDSWAVLAWLREEESAATTVQQIIETERPRISWVNLVEVEYQLLRVEDPEGVEQTLSDVRTKVDAELPGVERMRAVARLKAKHPIALADCFAVATAAAAGATLVTGDPEIVEREAELPCEVMDARKPPTS